MRECRSAVGAAAAVVLVAFAQAQAPYPAKQVRLILPFAPGGPSDIVGRVLEGKASVVLETGVGRRLLMEPEGEPLPRIC